MWVNLTRLANTGLLTCLSEEYKCELQKKGLNIFYFDLKSHLFLGLSKMTTCLRGLEASKP